MNTLTFADFCAGIGGFRIGLEKLGWKCVFSCDIDPNCEQTYAHNFGQSYDEYDIFDIDPRTLPYFDVLCAGFPCQPFSIAGKQLGLADPRGTVFDQIAAIARVVKPRVVFLENVGNLLHHDSGRTIKHITAALSELGYSVHITSLDSAFFGVPQSRVRVYILALDKSAPQQDLQIRTRLTEPTPFRDFIQKGDYSIPISDRWQEYIDLYTGRKTLEEMTFEVPKTRRSLERVGRNVDLDDCVFQMRSSGIRAYSIDQPLPTLAVSHSGGGAMIPVYTGERRHLSVIEMRRLMGFPENFAFPVSRTHAIKQLANAVCPPVVTSIGEDLVKVLGRL